MESVKLFYSVKPCDETNCFNNHIAKMYRVEDHIKSCFKTQLIRDKFLSYGFWQEATVPEVTHMQYLDSDGFIHVVSLASKEPILGHKLIINFRLLSYSPGFSRFVNVPSFELCLGVKFFLKNYFDHLRV